jgi:hypothetical protein
MSSKSVTPRASASLGEEKHVVDSEVNEPNKPTEGLESSQGISSDPEKGADGTVIPANTSEEHQYITGVKLFLVMAAVTLACFLMLLDTSIITTVSFILS